VECEDDARDVVSGADKRRDIIAMLAWIVGMSLRTLYTLHAEESSGWSVFFFRLEWPFLIYAGPVWKYWLPYDFTIFTWMRLVHKNLIF
jgi:hypothetical protein